MRHKIILSCVLVSVIAAAVGVQAFEEQASEISPQNAKSETLAEKHLVSIKLYELKGEGKEKVLCNPTVTAVAGQDFRSFVGGELKRDGFGDPLEFGTQVKGKVGKTKDGQLPVSLRIALGQLVNQQDRSLQVVRSQTVDIRADLEINESKNIQVSENIWCTISVE